MEQIEKLKVYIIGQPKVDLSLEFSIQLAMEDQSSLGEKLEFQTVSTIEEYNSFIADGTASGLVLFHDEIISYNYIKGKIEKAGKVPSDSKVRGLWGQLSSKYYQKLFDVLIPMIANKQIYFAVWTEYTPELTGDIMEMLQTIFEKNNLDSSNLCPQGFNMFEGYVRFPFKVCIYPILKRIFNGEIVLKKDTVKKLGDYKFKPELFG